MTESVKFSIYLNDLFRCDETGQGGASIPTASLQVPAGVVPGSQVNLEELVGKVGPQAININWYSRASGSVSDHDCRATWLLYVGGQAVAPFNANSSTDIPPAVVWRTSHNPNAGGPIDGPWVPMEGTLNKIVKEVGSYGDCDDSGSGTGCGCRFPSKGGWENAIISVRVDIEVMVPTQYTTKEGMTTDGIPSWVWWTIGVVVALLVLLTLGGLGYYFMRKKKGAKAMKQAALQVQTNLNAAAANAQARANNLAAQVAANVKAAANSTVSSLNHAANVGAMNVATKTGLASFY